jgi:hypothetical protein
MNRKPGAGTLNRPARAFGTRNFRLSKGVLMHSSTELTWVVVTNPPGHDVPEWTRSPGWEEAREGDRWDFEDVIPIAK